MNNQELDKEILETLAFFDLFEYPLTKEEIHKYLRAKCNLEDIDNKISNFLPGRKKIVEIKQARKKYFNKKLRKAKLVVYILRFIPWIKMVAISNVIGEKNLKQESDIDLFIITQKNRIWLTRFFAAGLMKVFGLRPKPGNEQDKICLNFYLAENNLDIKNLMLDSDDIYFIYWLAGLVPIYNLENTFEKFIYANVWLNKYLPNFSFEFKKIPNNYAPTLYNFLVDSMLGWTEELASKYQLKILPANLKDKINKDTQVVINNSILKLHSKDRRIFYRNLFNKKKHEIFR